MQELIMEEESTPPLSPMYVDLQAVSKAAEILNRGGVVAFPTETSYGLGASVDNADALQRIYEIKKRPRGKPLLVLIDSVARLDGLVSSIPPAARRLMDHFWPGPLTILFPAASGLAWPLHGGTGKIGVRISSNPWAQALVEKLGRPVTATSANLSGLPPAADAREVERQLASPAPDFILNGGILSHGTCSTIVDVSGNNINGSEPGAQTHTIKIIRAGVIPSEEIRQAAARSH